MYLRKHAKQCRQVTKAGSNIHVKPFVVPFTDRKQKKGFFTTNDTMLKKAVMADATNAYFSLISTIAVYYYFSLTFGEVKVG